MMNAPSPQGRSAAFVDDSRDGLIMFFVFTAAVVIVTGAVALLAVVGTWWMRAVAFAVHVAMTMVVVLTIGHVMTNGASARSTRGRGGRRWGRGRYRLVRSPWPT
jgi:fatty acid desaturase